MITRSQSNVQPKAKGTVCTFCLYTRLFNHMARDVSSLASTNSLSGTIWNSSYPHPNGHTPGPSLTFYVAESFMSHCLMNTASPLKPYQDVTGVLSPSKCKCFWDFEMTLQTLMELSALWTSHLIWLPCLSVSCGWQLCCHALSVDVPWLCL